MALNVTSEEKQPGIFTVLPFGRLDSETYWVLEKRIDFMLNEGRSSVVTLDMKGVDYISSMGIRVILKARKGLAQRNGNLLIVNLQPQIKKVFEIINALPTLQIFASIEELDAYLTEMQRRALEGE